MASPLRRLPCSRSPRASRWGERRAQGFFGPETATAWHPELDAHVRRAVPSPDQAKSHALDLRVGVIHDTMLTEGELGGGSAWV